MCVRYFEIATGLSFRPLETDGRESGGCISGVTTGLLNCIELTRTSELCNHQHYTTQYLAPASDENPAATYIASNDLAHILSRARRIVVLNADYVNSKIDLSC